MPITIIGNNGTGPPGPQGPGGTNGSNGSNGTNGTNGTNGAQGPAGSIDNMKTTIIDFGALPQERMVFNIVDPDVLITSKILWDITPDPLTKDADEIEMDTHEADIGAFNGNFNISVRGETGYLHDKFQLRYLVG